MSAGWTHCSLLAVKSLWSPTPAAPTPLLVTTCYLARALPFFLTLRPSKLWQRPQKTLPEPLLNLLLNELRWGVVAAGDPSVSSDLFDPSLECFCTCWIPWSLPLSPRAPITSLESAASVFTGSPTPSSSCPKCSFHSGVANGPPALFCLGSPRDDVSFANCPASHVPLCWEASRFFSWTLLSKPSSGRSVQRSPERRRRLTCPADGGPHLPTAASYTFTAQVWGRTLPAAPLYPTSRHVL